jgi:predicted LPLAT superfamily acyltransferase
MSTRDKKQWHGKQIGSPAGNRFMLWLIGWGGVYPAYFVCGFVALWYVLFHTQSRGPLHQFRTRLGLNTGWYHLYRHYLSFGCTLIDRYVFLLRGKDSFVNSYIGEELIADAYAGGKGLILLGAHCGNWEIAGNLLSERRSFPISVVMADRDYENMKQIFERAHRKRRISVITTGGDPLESTLKISEALRRGEVVSFLGDRTLDTQGDRITFFGKEARFPSGPFALAAVTGSPLIPFFALKVGVRHYRFYAPESIEIPRCTRDERPQAIRTAMERYVTLLEKTVREHPYQWYNYYYFWESGQESGKGSNGAVH